ncbi:MAG: hypothetical protein ACI9BK_002209, partial [Acidimicrobiales bacterium]
VVGLEAGEAGVTSVDITSAVAILHQVQCPHWSAGLISLKLGGDVVTADRLVARRNATSTSAPTGGNSFVRCCLAKQLAAPRAPGRGC